MTDKKVKAQPEVTGAVAYLDYNGVLKPTRDGVITVKKGDNLYPPSAIEGYAQELAKDLASKLVDNAVRGKLSAAILEEAKEWTGDSRGVVFLALSDLAKRLGVNISKNDLWAAQADHALIESPQPGVEEPAN